MFCPKCGTQNPDDGRFCRSCGADLGNVSAALAGNLPRPSQMLDRKGKPINFESAITKMFSGITFLAVAIALAFSIGRGWWFWLLIPAFGALGSGVAQYVQLKKSESHGVSFAPQNNALPPTKTDYVPDYGLQLDASDHRSALPPTKNDYVEPPKHSIYDTGELVENPGSVTEATTRHLKMDSEGETMTLPKK